MKEKSLCSIIAGSNKTAPRKTFCSVFGEIDKTDNDKFLFEICENIIAILNANKCILFELIEDSQELTPLYVFGNASKQIKLNKSARIPKGIGLAGWVMENQKTLIVGNTCKNPHYTEEINLIYGNKSINHQSEVNSIIAIPLMVFGEPLGVIEIIKNGAGAFSESNEKTVKPFINILAMAFQHRYNQALMSLAEVCIRFLEERDCYTHGHSLRVMQYCSIMADLLNLSKFQKNKLRLSAILHDIGKVTLKDSILNKQSKVLNERETKTIQMHPAIGFNIVSNINKPLAHIILTHHENYDGKGYPDNLKNDEIPLLSRIIGLADAFDAMTTDRPYRKALKIDSAIQEIIKESGKQFDPTIVKTFLTAYRSGKINLVTPYLANAQY
jgi:HD-GYP domain-containing protein (c-di-GMP phosphodiesterase class II)